MIKNSYPKVFMWMFIGLLVTFITGFTVSINENMLSSIFSTGLYFVLAIVEIVLVIFLSARINKMNPITAKISFILYAFVTGLTFSSIFVVYKLTSIMFVFLATALIFGVFALIGKFTNIDLSKLGTLLFMTLIGILLCTIINIFIGSSTFDLIICIISLIVFMGYVMYDMQKIKYFEDLDNENYAIFAALQLYLDFINIFINLIRLIGDRD